MKTKVEILQIAFDKSDKQLSNTTQVQFCYKAIYEAMELYAQQFKDEVGRLHKVIANSDMNPLMHKRKEDEINRLLEEKAKFEHQINDLEFEIVVKQEEIDKLYGRLATSL